MQDNLWCDIMFWSVIDEKIPGSSFFSSSELKVQVCFSSQNLSIVKRFFDIIFQCWCIGVHNVPECYQRRIRTGSALYWLLCTLRSLLMFPHYVCILNFKVLSENTNLVLYWCGFNADLLIVSRALQSFDFNIYISFEMLD